MKTKKLQLSMNRCFSLLSALNTLAGHRKVIKDGGGEKVVDLPLALSPNTRFALAQNHVALTEATKAFLAAQKALIQSLSGGTGVIKPDDENFGKYRLQEDELGEIVADVPLVKIAQADLQLDLNPIAPAVLAVLLTIIEPEA